MIDQALNEAGTVPKGIVKWWVEIFDETAEQAGMATILAMVRKNDLQGKK